MKEKEKGCVYFFRHVGLEPIKIGYSTNESPLIRFNQFKTYAPFGAEIVGFIQTNEAKKIETLLHQKYSSKRLDGEWFFITENECNNEIEFYSNKEDIKEKNDFQIAWSSILESKKQEKKDFLDIYKKQNTVQFEKFKTTFLLDRNINITKASKHFGVSRMTLSRWIKIINENK